MRRAFKCALTLGPALALAACQADREATQGVNLDRPEAIEQAPAMPTPPQPLGPTVGSAPQVGDTTLSLPQGDTLGTRPGQTTQPGQPMRGTGTPP